MRIFLSYGHDEHTSFALRLKADLEGRGHEVWFALDRLKPGADWESYIEEGLEGVSAVVGERKIIAGDAGGRLLFLLLEG